MATKHSPRFPVGKLPIRTLERLLKRNKIKDPRVIVGPGIGEDAAVIDTGNDRYLIAKTGIVHKIAAALERLFAKSLHQIIHAFTRDHRSSFDGNSFG